MLPGVTTQDGSICKAAIDPGSEFACYASLISVASGNLLILHRLLGLVCPPPFRRRRTTADPCPRVSFCTRSRASRCRQLRMRTAPAMPLRGFKTQRLGVPLRPSHRKRRLLAEMRLVRPYVPYLMYCLRLRVRLVRLRLVIQAASRSRRPVLLRQRRPAYTSRPSLRISKRR